MPVCSHTCSYASERVHALKKTDILIDSIDFLKDKYINLFTQEVLVY